MSGVILTAEHFYSHPRGNWHHLPASLWAWEKYPIPDWRRVMIGDLPRLGETDETVTATVVVNHGRWFVRCPFCHSAQIAAKSDRRFLCAGYDGCANVQVGGAFVNVEWPDEADALEEALVERPDPARRHWLPGETVEKLRSEWAAFALAAA
jgi:hypothetical protein